ncbi:MAG TPA: TSUP family transporter [Polyangia bacterium]|nr:TSUP family transporter [Polyangia bacterium]
MPSAKALLFGVLAAMGVAFIAIWARQPRPPGTRLRTTARDVAIGFVTNFFDTLGIGSFATTTALYKLGHAVADENIPGTLNVGDMIPTFAEAFIFIAIVEVEMKTLVLMVAAAAAGAWLGAGVVSGWPRARIQRGMGVLLIVAAAIMAARTGGLWPGYGEALGLSGARLAVAVVVNGFLGALMTLGIGLFAPCMILVALLGMNETAAFPIMMGSCAFLMPGASVRFVRSGRYDLSAALGLTLGGTPAVIIAAYWIKSLRLVTVKWLVVAVVVYTAVAMLRSARRERDQVHG